MSARAVAVFYFMLSLSILAAAMPGGHPTTTITVTAPPTSPTGDVCTTGGGQQCCNKLEAASDKSTSVLLALLGVVVQDLTSLVGFECVPFVGGNCNSNVVCCQANGIGNVISVGCIPISL